jgi:radical SAM superfamily enzyme YgiQ (UPF0313 family)
VRLSGVAVFGKNSGPHCDVLVEGEAEYTWPKFLRDYASGQHADNYQQEEKIHLPDSPPPRLDVLKRSYSQGIVQCTRGCPFTCEFCDIIVMYGRKMRYKPIAQVLKEVEAWQVRGVGKVFFADDNFIGNRAYAKELLRALIEWNARQRSPLGFYTQASVDMVRDEELLGLLRDANFYAVFIGIESPRKASLAESHKTQNEKLDLVQAIHKIQSYNLFVYAGMIAGFDADDAAIFDEQYEFLQAAGIPFAFLSPLDAVPRTPLHKRVKAEGRLLHPYSNGVSVSNMRPLRMTTKELKDGLQRLAQKLYSPEAFTARLMGNISRFRNVTFRPEAIRNAYVTILCRLALYYGRNGWAATKFFWSCLWKTLRQAPQFVGLTAIHLGMYLHVCVVRKVTMPWDKKPARTRRGYTAPLRATRPAPAD